MGFRPFTYLLLLVLCSCQPNYDGIYSTCWDAPEKEGCEYIVLNSDGTFIYSNPYNVSGNINTKGQWKTFEDTLILNTNPKLYEVGYGKSILIESSDSVEIIIKTIDPDGSEFDVTQFSSLQLGMTSKTKPPNELGKFILGRNQLDTVLTRHIGLRNNLWVTDINLTAKDNQVQLRYLTEYMIQEEFDNEKWLIELDSILIPMSESSHRTLIKRKKN